MTLNCWVTESKPAFAPLPKADPNPDPAWVPFSPAPVENLSTSTLKNFRPSVELCRSCFQSLIPRLFANCLCIDWKLFTSSVDCLSAVVSPDWSPSIWIISLLSWAIYTPEPTPIKSLNLFHYLVSRFDVNLLCRVLVSWFSWHQSINQGTRFPSGEFANWFRRKRDSLPSRSRSSESLNGLPPSDFFFQSLWIWLTQFVCTKYRGYDRGDLISATYDVFKFSTGSSVVTSTSSIPSHFTSFASRIKRLASSSISRQNTSNSASHFCAAMSFRSDRSDIARWSTPHQQWKWNSRKRFC